MAKGWTAERRAAYAEAMRARKAWEHSTGPRTKSGKKRATRNAAGRGCRQRLDAELAGVEALMREWEVVNLRERNSLNRRKQPASQAPQQPENDLGRV